MRMGGYCNCKVYYNNYGECDDNDVSNCLSGVFDVFRYHGVGIISLGGMGWLWKKK